MRKLIDLMEKFENLNEDSKWNLRLTMKLTGMWVIFMLCLLTVITYPVSKQRIMLKEEYNGYTEVVKYLNVGECNIFVDKAELGFVYKYMYVTDADGNSVMYSSEDGITGSTYDKLISQFKKGAIVRVGLTPEKAREEFEVRKWLFRFYYWRLIE